MTAAHVYTLKIGDEGVTEVFVEGRSYPSADEARAAWEQIAHLAIPDAGASRTRDPQDPSGPGRFVIYLAFGRPAWTKLRDAIPAGGSPWDPDENYVRYLVRKRVKWAAEGQAQVRERHPERERE
jgi:hypothetical protein